jgi:hypothetical protein
MQHMMHQHGVKVPQHDVLVIIIIIKLPNQAVASTHDVLVTVCTCIVTITQCNEKGPRNFVKSCMHAVPHYEPRSQASLSATSAMP